MNFFARHCNLPFHSKVLVLVFIPYSSFSFDSEDLACVAGAWKWWAQEKTGAPVLSFAHYFQAPATQASENLEPNIALSLKESR